MKNSTDFKRDQAKFWGECAWIVSRCLVLSGGNTEMLGDMGFVNYYEFLESFGGQLSPTKAKPDSQTA